MTDKQHVVELLDRLEPARMKNKLTEQDRQDVDASLEYFRKGGAGVPFEQVVADLGFTVDQIRNHPGDSSRVKQICFETTAPSTVTPRRE